ncbi:MAG: ribosome recycling factor [Deltaproteobacteria bacterium]|nr:ribosome recycling factor [Deltaproteobacteria bacterium]MDH3897011.1 ribosome recycling factor [Deltaproteobacteria bacterium]MDH3928884.1 ribosome recycling factor [Deltaproteobacteria bacterium]MDH3963561.1 ribosome recycling factor [Deltaproteobacteria bacterium]
MMVDEIFEDLKDRMGKSIESLKREYSRLRTGRASVSLLDGIRVSYYDTPTPLNQMASLAVPEPRLIVIQPWDKTAIEDIEKAILKSELGLTPMNDGKVIRISIPPLTEERRKELVKVARKMSEENKVSIRNIRRDANEMLKDLKKEKEITEDDLFRSQEEVQKATDQFISQVDELCAAKEKEILEI